MTVKLSWNLVSCFPITVELCGGTVRERSHELMWREEHQDPSNGDSSLGCYISCSVTITLSTGFTKHPRGGVTLGSFFFFFWESELKSSSSFAVFSLEIYFIPSICISVPHACIWEVQL